MRTDVLVELLALELVELLVLLLVSSSISLDAVRERSDGASQRASASTRSDSGVGDREVVTRARA